MNKTKLVKINFCHKYRFREIHIPNFQNINWTYLAKKRYFYWILKLWVNFRNMEHRVVGSDWFYTKSDAAR